MELGLTAMGPERCSIDRMNSVVALDALLR